MKIVESLAANWPDILVGVIFVAGAIAAFKKWAKPLGEMTTEEKAAHATRLLLNLVPIALYFVTEAEASFGDGTGPLKRAYVIRNLYELIPDQFKSYVSEENLGAVVEKALIEAKKFWSGLKPGELQMTFAELED